MSQIVVTPITKEYLKAVTTVHMEAFAGYLNTKIGSPYIFEFIKWFMNYPPATALLAMDGNEVLGYVVGAPVGYQKQMNRNLSGVALRGILTHPSVWVDLAFLTNLWSRFKVMVNSPKLPEDKAQLPTYSLVGIGVSNEARGKQVGSKLMAAFEREVKSQGFEKVRLSVYSKNQQAKGFYAKNGWSLEGQPGRVEVYSKLLS